MNYSEPKLNESGEYTLRGELLIDGLCIVVEGEGKNLNSLKAMLLRLANKTYKNYVKGRLDMNKCYVTPNGMI